MIRLPFSGISVLNQNIDYLETCYVWKDQRARKARRMAPRDENNERTIEVWGAAAVSLMSSSHIVSSIRDSASVYRSADKQ